jgi:chlorite dismutase
LPIELVNSSKEPSEQGLRLVEEPAEVPVIKRQFISFLFLKVDPRWRRLPEEKKAAACDEFLNIFDDYSDDLLLFNYSLIGFDSKADLMFWRIGHDLDKIQELTTRMFRTELGRYLSTVINYLTCTKNRMFVTGSIEDRLHINAGEKQYHFVYPCSKLHSDMSPEEHLALVENDFMVGKKFPNIRVHLTHAFGFGDQEYVLSFETDEPTDFLALAEELQDTPASKFALRGKPVYTCRKRPLSECLEALG